MLTVFSVVLMVWVFTLVTVGQFTWVSLAVPVLYLTVMNITGRRYKKLMVPMATVILALQAIMYAVVTYMFSVDVMSQLKYTVDITAVVFAYVFMVHAYTSCLFRMEKDKHLTEDKIIHEFRQSLAAGQIVFYCSMIVAIGLLIITDRKTPALCAVLSIFISNMLVTRLMHVSRRTMLKKLHNAKYKELEDISEEL